MAHQPIFYSDYAVSAAVRRGTSTYVNMYRSEYGDQMRAGALHRTKEDARCASERTKERPLYRLHVKFKRVTDSAYGLRVVA